MSYVATTTLDLLTLAAKSIGVLGQGETLPDDEATDGMQLLNEMVDSWATEKDTIFCITRNVFNLVQAKAVYTMGPGGDFNITPRPVHIESAYAIVGTSVTPAELEIELVDYDKWSTITLKNTPSTIPKIMWPDYAFPLINCSIYPTMQLGTTQQIAFYLWSALGQFTTLTQAINLPPGYFKALRTNLAVEWAPLYEREAPAQVRKSAAESKGYVKRTNKKIYQMTVDEALVSSSRAYNYLTGDVGR